MAERSTGEDRLRTERLAVAFGPKVIQRDLGFSVRSGSIFAVMGGSGCGKSTVLSVRPGTW
jgi:phospholipid/cholesterol/gamma-HCH transport system ATP-binding protein